MMIARVLARVTIDYLEYIDIDRLDGNEDDDIFADRTLENLDLALL